MKRVALIASVLLLSACSANMDMQGEDPYEFYKGHPIKNTVVSQHFDVETHFAVSAVKLSGEAMDALRSDLRKVSPAAVDAMVAELSPADMKNTMRRESLSHSLRALGYRNHALTFTETDDLEKDDVRIRFTYLVVVPPDCPDWRTSSVTTYSNTHQGNFDCANEVDTGMMIADPHDLLHGSGDVPLDTERASKAVQNYHAGVVPTATPASTTSPGGSSPSNTITPTSP